MCVLTFGAVVACNSGPATVGIETDDGTGGSGGGSGGSGGLGDGACTDMDDQAVYEGLTYTNAGSTTFTGINAAAEIAGDCVFGAADATPSLTGCNTEALNVIGCLSNCEGLIDELAVCVADCQRSAIAEVTEGGELSSDCEGCYGATVACSAGNCAFMGCVDPSSQACIDCQCRFNCSQDFDSCSGLPSTGDCD
jgi:hypothetical protein